MPKTTTSTKKTSTKKPATKKTVSKTTKTVSSSIAASVPQEKCCKKSKCCKSIFQTLVIILLIVIASLNIYSIINTEKTVTNSIESIEMMKVGGEENYKMFKKIMTSDAQKANFKQNFESAMKQMGLNDIDSQVLKDDQLSSLLQGYSKGSKSAKVAIIGYSDIECPYCKSFHNAGILEEVLEKNSDVKFVYKHFPLNMHRNAQKGAEAAECAGEQLGDDGFYSLLSTAYKEGKSEIEDLTKIAEDLGANRDNFTTCVESNKYANKVKGQMKEGNSVFGITGVPVSYVVNLKNGKRMQVPGRSVESFGTAIEKILK